MENEIVVDACMQAHKEWDFVDTFTEAEQERCCPNLIMTVLNDAGPQRLAMHDSCLDGIPTLAI